MNRPTFEIERNNPIADGMSQHVFTANPNRTAVIITWHGKPCGRLTESDVRDLAPMGASIDDAMAQFRR